MLELGVKILIAYLLGTLLGSLILGRMRGVDIRNMGSGNAGATNALRTQGKLFGFLVLLIDIAKGMIAVWWLPPAALPGIGIDAGVSREWLTMACGFAVIVGHVYPVWFDFRGGKGAATVVGVVAALELRLLVPLLLSWIIVLLLSGYVGLATMLSTIALAAAVLVLEPNNIPLCTFCAAVAVFVVFTHRGNIARMRAEKKIVCGVYGCFDRERLSPDTPAAASAAGGRRSALRRVAGGGAAPNPSGGMERR